MFNIKSAAIVVAASLFALSAKADPISEALDSVFHPRTIAAQTDVKSQGNARGRVHTVFRVRGSRTAFAPWNHRPVVASTPVPEAANRQEQQVWTSYYGAGEPLNRHTANGQVFNPSAMTAAHRTLPMGTKLLVSFHGRSAVVTINDRGPAAWTGRSLDLTYGAARAIGMNGLGWVHVSRLN